VLIVLYHIMTTRLCDCVYAKGRKLYEKFHENRGEVPPDYDTLPDEERDIWAKTVAGKGNYVIDDKPKRKPRAKAAKESTMLIGDGQATSFVEPDWDAKAKEQKRALDKMEREEKAAIKAAEREAKAQAKAATKGTKKILV